LGNGAMKARQLIDGASYGPETVKAMGEAFDQAWAEISGNFGDNPTQIESAQLRLADAVIYRSPPRAALTLPP
jgi:hypothetical protein